MAEPRKPDEQEVDPKTGETVSWLKIPDVLLAETVKLIDANNVTAQNFLGLSRQIVTMEKAQMQEFEKACACEKEIGLSVLKIRDKMGLDSAWMYNPMKKMMEKREPPVASLDIVAAAERAAQNESAAKNDAT